MTKSLNALKNRVGHLRSEIRHDLETVPCIRKDLKKCFALAAGILVGLTSTPIIIAGAMDGEALFAATTFATGPAHDQRSALMQNYIKDISDLTQNKDASWLPLSQAAFQDTRLSEKDLINLDIGSGFNMSYSVSGALVRDKCLDEGISGIMPCASKVAFYGPETPIELSLGGLTLAFGLYAGVALGKAAYRKTDKKLDKTLPGWKDHPQQMKLKFR